MLQQIVSLTSQNQVSIPIKMVREWGSDKTEKVLIVKVGDEVRIRPVRNFWSVAKSLKSKIVLSDRSLNEARKEFTKSWGKIKSD